MARYTGLCKNCGDEAHPKGNVFTPMKTWEFEIDNFRGFEVPKTEWVKVCNNCSAPHPFYRRQSAKAKRREALIEKLIGGDL